MTGGIWHYTDDECAARGCKPAKLPVSVTVTLGRGDDITENIAAITRALGGEV